MQTILPSVNTLKKQAHQLREKNPKIKNHTSALNIIATHYGYKNWATLLPNVPNSSKFNISIGNTLVPTAEANEDTRKGVKLREDILSFLTANGSFSTGKNQEADREGESLCLRVIEHQKYTRNHTTLSYFYNNFSELALHLRRYKEAMMYANASLLLNQHLGDEEGIYASYQQLLNISLVTTNHKMSIKYLGIMKDINNPSMFADEAVLMKILGIEKEALNIEPTFDMNAHIEYPFKFEVLFGEDEHEKRKEIEIRSLCHRRVCTYREAEELLGVLEKIDIAKMRG